MQAHGHVVFRVFGIGIARAYECSAGPVEQVGRAGKARLVAGAVEADVEHVEAAVGAEDDGVVDGQAVEVLLVSGALQDKLRVFIWGAIGRNGIFGGSQQGRRRHDECSVFQELAASDHWVT